MKLFKRRREAEHRNLAITHFSFTHQFLELSILTLLQERDYSVLELADVIQAKGIGWIEYLTGQVSGVCYYLTVNDLVRSYWEEYINKKGAVRQREVYAMLPDGQARLERIQGEFDRMMEGIRSMTDAFPTSEPSAKPS